LGESIDSKGDPREAEARTRIANNVGAEDRQHKEDAQQAQRGNKADNYDRSDFSPGKGIMTLNQRGVYFRSMRVETEFRLIYMLRLK
jgi:hypothetical protein